VVRPYGMVWGGRGSSEEVVWRRGSMVGADTVVHPYGVVWGGRGHLEQVVWRQRAMVRADTVVRPYGVVWAVAGASRAGCVAPALDG
jgi:hypothetical protein